MTKENPVGKQSGFYIMEHEEETDRLEKKTDPSDVRRQAEWCGIKPGQRLLDVCCGPGKTTAILRDLVQPEGSILGLDSSPKRIAHAMEHYGKEPGIEFAIHDILTPLTDFGTFDAIWVRFVLEYYREQNKDIVRNLANSLNPGGSLFLIDLDYNCLSHYDLPLAMAKIIPEIMNRLEAIYNFDAFAGRKLYSHLFDLGFQEIEVQITAHHVIYGTIRDIDSYNWMKKIEVVAPRLADLFESYPGGYQAFLTDFRTYFHNPRRFTYTPLILCKGKKPAGGAPAQS
jgi:ubiquinone/menaquinone biosynthesis C-methylase UbiE